ncbi:hypothetical protein BIV57_11635 [Mangrovactinospora gilvigrisea]|uniref:Uncharacterized protein n=1 Tax=Mangrovactinospora gilvigrisea TaxID=1428644 RepID=A0A1J7C6W1_9ACTN|nr:hypothetical protein [Mangrovactinospora gilvigrisea]OIV37296.1 hypothetical protein BIV57_11635 [Mangrovactinospora gilvigrisea]
MSTPPEPTPEPLRFFGTTWVDRGGAYWARRTGFVVAVLICAAAGAFVLRFGLQGLSVGEGSPLLSLLGTLGVGICSAVAAGRTWTRLDADRRSRPAAGVVVRQSAAAKAEAAEAEAAKGSARKNPQTPLMILGFVGWLLAHAVHGFVEAPGETGARRALEHARAKAAKPKARRVKAKAKAKRR